MNTTSQITPSDNPEGQETQGWTATEHVVGGYTGRRSREDESKEVTLSVEKERAVIAILAAAGPNVIFSSTQLQILCFLANKEVHEELGRPDFNFAPHGNGPADYDLDKQIQIMLQENQLMEVGEVTSQNAYYSNRISSGYMLTQKSYFEGRHTLEEFEFKISDYLERAGTYVLSMDFKSLICNVCRDNPEMGTNLTFPAWGGHSDPSLKTPEARRAWRLEKMRLENIAKEKAENSG